MFQSYASDLVLGDTNDARDIFRRDLVTGAVERVSTKADGTQINLNSEHASVSHDGRYILFESVSDLLVTSDTNSKSDVFRKDMVTGEVVRVSTNAAEAELVDFSLGSQISADGKFALFGTQVGSLVAGDTNNTFDIFRKNITTGEIVCVSSHGATIGNGASFNGPFGADSNSVIFDSVATNLGAFETNNASDVFIRNLESGSIARQSVSIDGNEANGPSDGGVLTSDGRYLVFASAANNLVAGDTNNAADIFRKDLVDGGKVIRVSTGVGDTEATGGFSSNASVSADGRYVVFVSTASNLVMGDTNSVADVFRKDLVTGEIVRLSASAAGIQGDDESLESSISQDGRYVVFSSNSSNLTAGDGNGNKDVFRVDTALFSRAAALAEGRIVEMRFGTGSASSLQIVWGDGTADTAAPMNGSVAFSHTYATAGAKAVLVTSHDGELTSITPYRIDLAAGQMARSTTQSDTVTGAAGNDVLVGDSFANILIGKGGNDTYVVDNALDVVSEDGAAGIDTVFASTNYQLTANVENLTGAGTAGLLLKGTSVANIIKGTTGHDRIHGGAGRDTLSGSSGRDIFVFDAKPNKRTNVDKIADFNVKDDTIQLAKSVFNKIAKKGTLAKICLLDRPRREGRLGSDRLRQEDRRAVLRQRRQRRPHGNPDRHVAEEPQGNFQQGLLCDLSGEFKLLIAYGHLAPRLSSSASQSRGCPDQVRA